jgi:ATP-binding cassette subfamily A (ABC1) protein 3
MIAMAVFIQTMFMGTKNGTFAALFIGMIFFNSSLALDTEEDMGVSTSNKFAISPIAGVQLASKVLIVYEQEFRTLPTADWFKYVANFQFGTWFMITFVWILVLLALSFWLDQVFVTEIGEKKHPFFCFGCKKKFSDKSVRNAHESDEYLEMQPKETDLEPVDQALQGQTKANQTLIVDKLRKVYGNGTVAVGCLDLEMYSNQIFALLGQNGAGKSTTISIISGLLTKTQGSVRILGKNRDTELDEIRKMIGVCPQTNPIYSELTVYEHMELYAKIKGRENGPEIKLEIDTIL